MMLRLRPRPCLLIVLLVAALGAQAGEAAGTRASWSERAAALIVAEHAATSADSADRVRDSALAAAYALFLGTDWRAIALVQLSDAELVVLFNATDRAGSYSNDLVYADHLADVATELFRRKAHTDKQLQTVADSYAAARAFGAAQAWQARVNTASPPMSVNTFIDAHRVLALPTVLRFSPDAATVTREDLDLRHGPHIVAVIHPLCHFSANAMAMILKDPALRDAVVAHTSWIAPQRRESDFAMFRDWNKAHADTPMVLAYASTEWAFVSNWETPLFYFFENGELRATVTGWPSEGRLPQLRAALAAIHL